MSDATFDNDVWTRERVLDLIANSKAATVRALKVIYSRQTDDERAAQTTKHHNARGFNGRDAQVLSDIASKLPRYNNNLTDRQLVLVRTRITKYWRQLLEEIENGGKRVEWPAGAKPKTAKSSEEARERENQIVVMIQAWGAWA